MSERIDEIIEVVQKMPQVLTEGFEENRVTARYRQAVESIVDDVVEKNCA